MKCPFCGNLEDRVVDSRITDEEQVVRRRRECEGCKRRFTTKERVEEVPRVVVKKDERREAFSREKVLQGLSTACQKLPVPRARLEEVVDRLEQRIRDTFDHEVPANFIGEVVVEELKEIHPVAFVRFASVYQEFANVSEFLRELAPLVEKESGGGDRLIEEEIQ